MTSSQNPKNIKVIFTGNGGCGKTQILHALKGGKFEVKYVPTFGVKINTLKSNGINFDCWDCSGQERYSSLHKSYYTQACTVVICFSSNSKLEINSIGSWVKMAKKENPTSNIVLMATKNDLPPHQELSKIRKRYNIPLIETSAKRGNNLTKIFEFIYIQVQI